MLELTVLGHWGAYPEQGEATSGYLLHTDQGTVLMDCGSGVLAQFMRYGTVGDLAAVIITHQHHDHVADLGALGYAALLDGLSGKRKNPLPVYHPNWPQHITDFFTQSPWLKFIGVEDREAVPILDMNFHFRKTLHPVECMAVRITHEDGVFTYSADSSFSDSLVEHASNSDLFLCEASMYKDQYIDAQKAGHLTSEQCGRLAFEAGVKRLAITHFPHYGDLHILRSEVEEAFGKSVIQVSVKSVLKL